MDYLFQELVDLTKIKSKVVYRSNLRLRKMESCREIDTKLLIKPLDRAQTYLTTDLSLLIARQPQQSSLLNETTIQYWSNPRLQSQTTFNLSEILALLSFYQQPPKLLNQLSSNLNQNSFLSSQSAVKSLPSGCENPTTLSTSPFITLQSNHLLTTRRKLPLPTLTSTFSKTLQKVLLMKWSMNWMWTRISESWFLQRLKRVSSNFRQEK